MMDYGIVKLTLRTPVSIGKAGNYPVLDSVLMQRLGLLFHGDIDQARQHMPLARHSAGFWLCGGGYDPMQQRAAPQPYKVYRRLASDRTLIERMDCTPREFNSQISRLFGQETLATEWSYRRDCSTTQLHLRFQGELEQVERLLRLEPFIGPGHSVGLGEIETVTVDEAQGDLRWLMTDARRRLTRPLPQAIAAELGLSTGMTEWGAIEAPYWHQKTPRSQITRPLPAGL